jgi:type I restriction-modification system DNA methylase subunit
MITKEEAYKRINDLVVRFEEQLSSYKSINYNETLTRRDFIDPFFQALGWDVDNSQGYAEAYREVIHEDRVKIDKATKAPDYSFKLAGGKRLFFVEAKKPSVSIKDDISVAYQIRRYGWSAKLPVSIITDFEEFAVYDCTKKPVINDKSSVARIKYITYKQYIEEFEFLWDTFSKERVLKGSFDKFVLGTANKKGTATVDKEFLISLDNWRTYLATSISLKNKELDEEEINFVVQQTIDRIIFLRIAEDRSIETYGNLKSALNQGDYYQNLFTIFTEADQKYNSGLFDLKKDQISKDVKIDNKVLKTVINQLYYPESPYEFSVLSVEILGSAYEQFLGKQIKIDKYHRASIEEKPEVRKAGGVYYTPQYVVEYIVKNTVGKMIEGKTPAEVAKITICDPACGSGSFLIGAYQYLLDWHLAYYQQDIGASPDASNQMDARGLAHVDKKSKSCLTPEGNLTTSEKKRILLNNIYGVDIDVNAVEVTKLSLLLKCMEGETEASIATQINMFKERVLPTLDNNIKDGNSLIDIDYYATQMDFGEEKKIKPFSWQKAFAEVFKQGGFDCVIGNPPYGANFTDEEKKYLSMKYVLQDYQLDSYFLFLEKSLEILKYQEKLGFIIPNTWLMNLKSNKIRQYLFSHTEITNIVHYQIPVFTQAVVDTEIIIFRNIKPSKTHEIKIEIYDKKNEIFESKIRQQDWIDANGSPVNIFDNEKYNSIKLKILKLPILDTICKITQGTKPFQVGKGNPKQTREIVEEKPFVSDSKIDDFFRPLLRGSSMNRYQINWKNNYFIKFGDWLAEPRYSAGFDADEKIIIRQTGDHLNATLDTKQFIVRDNLYTIVKKKPDIDLRYILGLINSKFLNWFYQNILNPEKGEVLAQVKRGHIALLPIKEVIQTLISERDLYNEIISLVDQLLKLNEEKAETKLQTKISQIESKIDYCENRINQIVYQLYDLTEEEIKIVEGE